MYKYITDPYARNDSHMSLSSFTLINSRNIRSKITAIRIQIPSDVRLIWDENTKTYSTNCKKPLIQFDPTCMVNRNGEWVYDLPYLDNKPINEWDKLLMERGWKLIPGHSYVTLPEYENWMNMKHREQEEDRKHAEMLKQQLENGTLTSDRINALSVNTCRNILKLYAEQAQE